MNSTFKQRFLEMTGKEVPLDYFLYTCFEAEKMLAGTEKRAGGPEKVESRNLNPALAEGLSATNEAAWERAIGSLYDWHCAREQALLDRAPVDIERLCAVADEFAAFHADLQHLFHVVTGEGLPVFDEEAGLAPVWVAATNILDEKSPSASGLFKKFFAWAYNTWEPQVFEVGSRPPVGRYSPPPRLRTGGPGGRPAHQDRGDRPERPAHQDRGGRPEHSDRPAPRSEHADRPQRDDRPRRDDRPQHDNRPQRDDRPRHHDDERSMQQEKEALAEVEKAIAKLTSDASTEFVDLPPTNSFQRRKQHHETNERGFQTQSVGEGHDRAVRVTRNPGK